MSRWIDADALIADLDKGLWGKDYDKALAEAIIQDAPSIDIVRCKECVYWIDDRNDENDMGTCRLTHYFTDETDFCSYGERKDEP